MVNLIPNPGFEGSLAGWSTLGVSIRTRETSGAHSGVACMRIASTGGGAQTAAIAVASGSQYDVTCWVRGPAGTKVSLLAGAAAKQATQTGVWQQITNRVTAAAGTLVVGVRSDEPDSQTFFVDDFSLELYTPPPPPPPPGTWELPASAVRLQADDGTGTWPITVGKVRTVQIVRGEAEPGTIRVDVYDATLDVTTSTALRVGKPVRFQVDNGAGGWKTIAQGHVANPVVDYDPIPGASVPVNVKVETADRLSTLQNTPEARGVGTIDQLKRLLTAAGIPYVINGSSAADAADPDVVATNDNASMWDQILVTRDSVLGYAWVDMDNKFRAYDADSMDTGSKADLTPAVYSGIDLDFALDQIINTVIVKWRRYDIGSEQSVDVPYGPFTDDASVLAWGARTAEFTIQGATEVEADIVDFAEEVLIRNSTAERRPRTVTIPIRTAADLAYVRDIDINSRVTVTHPDGATEIVLRVVGIEHNITADFDRKAFRWFMTLTLALPAGVAIPSQTPGTGNNVLPDNLVTDDELDDVVSDLEDQVQDALDEANEAANFAQSKNAVYYKTTKPTAPPDGPFRRGDVWFDIDDGNRIYVYVDSPTNDFVLATASYLTTPNGRLVVTPSGLFCYDASMVLKFFLDAATGGITMAGALISGGDVTGATVTGGTVQTSSLVQRGIKMNSTFLLAYDASGNPVLAINASTGAITMIGELLAGSFITGAEFRTNTAGQRVRIFNDSGVGKILFYSGLGSETPGFLQHTVVSSQAVLELRAGRNATKNTPPVVLLQNDGAGGVATLAAGSSAGLVEIHGGTIDMSTGGVGDTSVEVAGEVTVETTMRAEDVARVGTDTVATVPNVQMNGSGFIKRTTHPNSSRRYKLDEQPAELDVEAILRLRPVTYLLNPDAFEEGSEIPTGRQHGFIAEDAVDVGLEWLVQLDDQGRPDLYDYAKHTVALHAVARHEHERANQLEARVARLERLIEEGITR